MIEEYVQTQEKTAPTLDMEQLWTIEQLAYYLNVSVHQARKYYEEQELPYVILGPKTFRFRKVAVDAWVVARETCSALN